jgi:hypothetical protein
VTDAGVPATSTRAASKAWMAMSTISGCAISSRKPPKRGAREKRVATRPAPPRSPASRAASRRCGLCRRDWETMNSLPVASACPASESASARVAAHGFSPSTGYPACSASAVTRVVGGGDRDVDDRCAPRPRGRPRGRRCRCALASRSPRTARGPRRRSAAAPSMTSATPTRRASRERSTVEIQALPMPPAPTTTTGRASVPCPAGSVRVITRPSPRPRRRRRPARRPR